MAEQLTGEVWTATDLLERLKRRTRFFVHDVRNRDAFERFRDLMWIKESEPVAGSECRGVASFLADSLKARTSLFLWRVASGSYWRRALPIR